MVKDHQEFNIGVLDIYGFEIFQVSVFACFEHLHMATGILLCISTYIRLTGINVEHLDRLNIKDKTDL